MKDEIVAYWNFLSYWARWAWEHPRAKHMRKVLYNFKLTVICGVITFLVFRGTMGAGSFGTPLHDVDIINRELIPMQEQRLLDVSACAAV